MFKFSIIVPIYNVDKYVNRCINSVLNQTYKNFELILINDGSTDNSLKIIKGFKDKRIRIIDKKHTGVADTRNVGIRSAKCEYIIFIDSDDYIEKNMLEEYINIINKYNPDMISCGIYSEVNGHYDILCAKERYYKNKSMLVNDLLYLYDSVMLYNVWNKVFKKSIIDNFSISFPNYDFGEDIDFNHQYLKYINTLYNSNACLYHYVRGRKGSLTLCYHDDLFDIRIKENREFIDFFNFFNIKQKDYLWFIAKHFIERVVGCIENVFSDDNSIVKTKYNKIKGIINHEETKYYLKHYIPKTTKMKIIIIPIKYKMTFTCYIMGLSMSLVKKKCPRLFNKLKNKR